MIDNSSVTLENNINYQVVDKIIDNNITYVYLVNNLDINDFCVRKEIVSDNKTYLVGLDNKEEADKALTLFNEKHKNDN